RLYARRCIWISTPHMGRSVRDAGGCVCGLHMDLTMLLPRPRQGHDALGLRLRAALVLVVPPTVFAEKIPRSNRPVWYQLKITPQVAAFTGDRFGNLHGLSLLIHVRISRQHTLYVSGVALMASSHVNLSRSNAAQLPLMSPR